MATNQNKITSASYNYLFEIAALPKETRTEFLNKLLKRKNACEKKNVKLLKILFDIVENDKIYEWNPESVCKAIDVNKYTLYRYKSRLLKKLKNYYTGWNEKEITIVNKVNYSGTVYDEKERDLKIRLNVAMEKYETGLRNEAKNQLLKILLKLKNNSFDKKFRLITRIQIYEKLVTYYTLINNNARAIYFLKLLNRTVISSNKLGLSLKEITKINIWHNYGNYSMERTYLQKDFNNAELENLLNETYRCALKINSKEYILKALHGLITVNIEIKNYRKAEYYSKIAYKAAEKAGNNAAKYTFTSALIISQFHQGKNYFQDNYKEILNYYFLRKNSIPLDTWSFYLEYFCAEICRIKNIPGIEELYQSKIDANILSGSRPYAASMLFYLGWEYFINCCYTSFLKSKDNWIYLDKIEKPILNKAEIMCSNILKFHNIIKNKPLIWNILFLQLLSVYFSEEDFDDEKINHIISKMERIIKIKNNKLIYKSYDILMLCVKLLDKTNTASETEKYIYPFKKLIDEFKKNPHEIDLMLYAIISSMSRRVKNNEITAIVKDLYHWLETNHPEILAPALREIEERASKVKLIDGSKQSAA